MRHDSAAAAALASLYSAAVCCFYFGRRLVSPETNEPTDLLLLQLNSVNEIADRASANEQYCFMLRLQLLMNAAAAAAAAAGSSVGCDAVDQISQQMSPRFRWRTIGGARAAAATPAHISPELRVVLGALDLGGLSGRSAAASL